MVGCDVLTRILDNIINNLHINITLDITITATVAIMGLRRMLFGIDPKEFEALKAEHQDLEARVERLEERLNHIAEVSRKVDLIEERLKILNLITDQTKENRLWIKELLKDIEDLRLEIEAIKLKSAADLSSEEKPDEIELEARVYELITKGYHSPTKLAAVLGISKEKLYRILNRLMEARLITTKGKGRKKKYVLKIEEEAE